LTKPALPQGMNPLAARIGRKIRAVTKARGLTDELAAAQLGISLHVYNYICDGNVLPRPMLAQRIYGWALQGISYEGAPQLTYSRKDKSDQAKAIVKVALTEELDDRLGREAARIGFSKKRLVQLLVERGIENRVAFGTLADATEAINKAAAHQVLTESPEIQEFLLSEMDIVGKPVETVSWNKIGAIEPDILKLDKFIQEEESEEIE
jgi:transcriptional regulator with XRE-family HTH domain